MYVHTQEQVVIMGCGTKSGLSFLFSPSLSFPVFYSEKKKKKELKKKKSKSYFIMKIKARSQEWTRSVRLKVRA